MMAMFWDFGLMEVLGSMPWFGILVSGPWILVEDLATVPGSPGFWWNSWVIVDSGLVTNGYISNWPQQCWHLPEVYDISFFPSLATTGERDG